MNDFVIEVLGLENKSNSQDETKLNGVVDMLITMRNQARTDKNWALSDEIRDKLLNLGIQRQ